MFFIQYCLAVIATTAILFPAAAPSQDATGKKELEKKVRQVIVGKIATFRQFHKSDDLSFDADGRFIGAVRTGPWTYYGRIEIESVRFEDEGLVIHGMRVVAQWDKETNEFRSYSLQSRPARISVAVRPEVTEADLAKALDEIFLSHSVRLSDVVPDFWKEMLTTERTRREAWEKQQAGIRQGVIVPGPEVSDPKLLSKDGGVQISRNPYKDLTDNQLGLSYIVDEKGDVKDVQIERPLGLGIDDPIAEMVSHWKFEPAKKGDQPVAVVMHGRFTWFHREGRIDPYRTQPCPFVENVFQC
jgi:hypothetical protein